MSPIPVALYPIYFITIDDNIEKKRRNGKSFSFEMKNQHRRVRGGVYMWYYMLYVVQ